MGNCLRDAVLRSSLPWNTDIVSVGERHVQAVDGGCGREPITSASAAWAPTAEFRSYRGGWAQAPGVNKFGTHDRLPLSRRLGTVEGFSEFGTHDLLPLSRRLGTGGGSQKKGILKISQVGHSSI